jgi:hypothetical protein
MDELLDDAGLRFAVDESRRTLAQAQERIFVLLEQGPRPRAEMFATLRAVSEGISLVRTDLREVERTLAGRGIGGPFIT